MKELPLILGTQQMLPNFLELSFARIFTNAAFHKDSSF